MKTVLVKASHSYEVHIGQGILSQLGQWTDRLISGKNPVIVSDSNVWAHYGEALRQQLLDAGFLAGFTVFSPGESSKNFSTLQDILNFLAINKIQRNDCVIALGGGVVGDLAGFAAACYMRGIGCIQVPTTLLAMVDASVGGKTAVNLEHGKNLCGTFHQPLAVVCDTYTLNTLPEHHFREGCAEIIKYGVLYDPDLFAQLEKTGLDFDREMVISRCIGWKAQVICQDEFDTGARRMLNLGHTLGHAVEAVSGYRISHGQAVAIGMAIVARAAAQMGICQQSACTRILSVLEAFGLPVRVAYHPEVLLQAALADKKAEGSKIHVILPEAIGRCRILPVDDAQLLALIKAGL